MTIQQNGTIATDGIVTSTGFTIGSAAILEAELEILDGATLTTTELNYVDGVTSLIQTQIDANELELDNSAGLLAALDDETGSGLAVFGTSPVFLTSIGLPQDGTVDAEGEITTDATSGQIRYYANGAERVLVPFYVMRWNYGSSTQGSGTTTRRLGTAADEMTFTEAECNFNDFMDISLYDGTNRADLIQASSTVGTVTFSTNNTFTDGENILIDIGTTTDIAAGVDGGCTFIYTYDAD